MEGRKILVFIMLIAGVSEKIAEALFMIDLQHLGSFKKRP
jgi:hypothetical protein